MRTLSQNGYGSGLRVLWKYLKAMAMAMTWHGHVMTWHDMTWTDMAMSFHIMTWHAWPCHVMAMSCHVMSWPCHDMAMSWPCHGHVTTMGRATVEGHGYAKTISFCYLIKMSVNIWSAYVYLFLFLQTTAISIQKWTLGSPSFERRDQEKDMKILI